MTHLLPEPQSILSLEVFLVLGNTVLAVDPAVRRQYRAMHGKDGCRKEASWDLSGDMRAPTRGLRTYPAIVKSGEVLKRCRRSNWWVGGDVGAGEVGTSNDAAGEKRQVPSPLVSVELGAQSLVFATLDYRQLEFTPAFANGSSTTIALIISCKQHWTGFLPARLR